MAVSKFKSKHYKRHYTSHRWENVVLGLCVALALVLISTF